MKIKKHQKIQSTFIEYILDSEIGCGGNAHVWEVHNVSDKQRKFAMKILKYYRLKHVPTVISITAFAMRLLFHCLILIKT